MTETQIRFLEFCKEGNFDPTEPQTKAIFEKVNIVAAGAGSGKTAVLSHRFLYLVMTGIHSDEILTMTFTKDATANMKKKIYLLLKRAANEKLIDESELNRFSRATISTTDGFCSEIAKSACSDFGITSKFQIESDEDLLSVSSKITEELLNKYNSHPQLKCLLKNWSMGNISEFFKKMAGSFIAISRPIDFSKFKSVILQEFGDSNNDDLKLLVEQYVNAVNSLPSPSKTAKENLVKAKLYLDNQDYSSLFHLLKINKSGKEEIKQMIEEIKDYTKKFLYVHPQSLELLDFMSLLCTDFQENLYRHKRETGCITFRDVLLMAIDTLQTNEEIRLYYQKKFKSVMVDEFQDNNEDNKTLVYLIAGSHRESVFMVGDEKQSIYRFRDADVSVFKGMTGEFGAEKVVQLKQNFRSEKKLIDVVNDIFKVVFKNAEKSYEASYTDLISTNNHVEPQILFMYNEEEESALTKTAEAENVADLIQDILNTKKHEFMIPCKEGLKYPEPADISILIKTGSHQILYENALRKREIPYEAVENKSFTTDAISNDFYNLFQLAVWGASDEIAWEALKNSPLGCKKNEQELYLLINDIRLKLSSRKLAEVVSYIWFDLGYRFFILRNKNNHQFDEHYEYLFALAVSFDEQGKTVVDFIDYLRPMLGAECHIKDVQIQRESEAGVKIMTIHKSKGLEFPIVIIPDMHSKGNGGGFDPNIRACKTCISYPYVSMIEGKKQTLINPLRNKDEEADMDFAETKRVLYVAATRAQYHLVFSGIVKRNKDGKYPESMMGCFLEAVDFFGNRNEKIKYLPYSNSFKENDDDTVNYVKGNISWYDKTYNFKFRKLTTSITSLDDGKKTDFAEPLKLYGIDELEVESTDFGTYVHELLERTVNGEDTENYYGSFESHQDKETIRRSALNMRDNFIDSSFYKSLSDFEKFTERSFFFYDKEVYEGIIDLLCEGKDKVVIVDYKTDRFKDVSTHKEQLETYVKAMAEEYGKPVEAYLFYVRSGEAIQI